MKTWFVYPENEAATQALAQINENRAYSSRDCIDRRGVHNTLRVTKATEAEIERLDKDRKNFGLDFTTFLQETEGGKIRERTLREEKERRLRRYACRSSKPVSKPSIARAILSPSAREALEKMGVRSGFGLRTGLPPR